MNLICRKPTNTEKDLSAVINSELAANAKYSKASLYEVNDVAEMFNDALEGITGTRMVFIENGFGVIGYARYECASTQDAAFIETFYISPAYQESDVENQLLEAIAKDIYSHGKNRLAVTTSVSDEKSMYKRLGFEPSKDHYIKDGFVKDVA